LNGKSPIVWNEPEKIGKEVSAELPENSQSEIRMQKSTDLKIFILYMMKCKFYSTVVLFLVFTSCGNVANEIDDELNKLKSKTESLDSMLNKEVNKVLTLDSLLVEESDKVKKLDSLINKSSSKIDSLSAKGSELLEKIRIGN